jgi:ribosomal protein L28
MYTADLFREFHDKVLNRFYRIRFVDTNKYIQQLNTKEEKAPIEDATITQYLADRQMESNNISELNKKTHRIVSVGFGRPNVQKENMIMNKVKNTIRNKFGADILEMIENQAKLDEKMTMLEGLSKIDEEYGNAINIITRHVKRMQLTINALTNIGQTYRELYATIITDVTELVKGYCDNDINIIEQLGNLYKMVEKNISEDFVAELRLAIAKYMYYYEYIEQIQKFQFLKTVSDSTPNPKKHLACK